jgi:hypothetical protein
MQRAGCVGVVEIEAMGQRAVQHGCPGRGVAGAIAEHGGATGRQPEGAGRGEQGRGALRIMPAADDVADEVEHEEARALLHFRRQGREIERRAIFGNGFGDGGHDVSPSVP